MRILTALVILVLGVSLGPWTPAAQASHYRLDRVPFVTAAERDALASRRIDDTEALLRWTAGLSDRVWLARVTGLEVERLTQLAMRCDLLRVDGIGPTMVAALQKAGVRDTRALAWARAKPLTTALRRSHRGTPQFHRLPEASTVRDWIDQARRLRPVLVAIPATPRDGARR